jgi:hypothetical protein
VLTVAAFAFLGAYLFALNTLVRAVATFDLSPLTFTRLCVHVVIGVAGAITLFRAFPDLITMLPPLENVPIVNTLDADGLPFTWYAAAFILGLLPDLAVNELISRFQNLQGSKIRDNSLLASTKSISPEVIDGIDFFIRFRLQQADIYEVQHLAVANPIMLFVETPYGIYQCIDWVAQAQLCTVVGPERFLALRSFNIRTVFDVERAILGEKTTSQLRRLVGALMFTIPPEQPKRAWRFWDLRKATNPGLVGSTEFGDYVAQLLGEIPTDQRGRPMPDSPDQTLIHFANIVLDDLHVHRLRDIWLLIESRLKRSGRLLPDSIT